jgi:tetratricopeptide (TPR) repeat protein
MDVSDMLHEGVAAARSGQREQARRLLTQLVRVEPNHEYGWLWLSTVVEDSRQALECLQRVLVINPANRQAIDRVETLKVVQLLQSEHTPQGFSAAQGDLRLGEWLVRHNMITQSALDTALRTQRRVARVQDREPLGTILLHQGAITPECFAAALEYQVSRHLNGRLNEGVFRQLGYYLVKHGYLTATQLANAITRQTLLAQRGKHIKLGELLINERMLRRDQLDMALNAQRQDYDRQFGTERDKLW